MAGFVVVALGAGVLLAGQWTTKYSGRPPENVPVTYEFSRDWPSHDTTRITFRSSRKPAGTLFVTGRNHSGSPTIKFPALGELKGLGADPKLMGLLGKVEVKGEFAAAASHYSAGREGADEFVGADWLRKGIPPVILLTVKSVSNWQGYQLKKDEKAPHKFTYRAKLEARLSADSQNADVTIPSAVIGFDPATSETSPATMTLRGTFSIEGSKLGLKGDDAGTIEVSFVMAGVTKYAATEVDAVKTEVEAKKPKMELEPDSATSELEGL